MPVQDQMTVEEFLAFTETRPAEECWELIEGRPVLQASPTKPHQIIATNIGGLLWFCKDADLHATWVPLQGVGTIVPISRNSLPQPDFMVLATRLGR